MPIVHIHIECDSGDEFGELFDRVKGEAVWAIENGYVPEEEYASPRGYHFSIEASDDEEGDDHG